MDTKIKSSRCDKKVWDMGCVCKLVAQARWIVGNSYEQIAVNFSFVTMYELKHWWCSFYHFSNKYAGYVQDASGSNTIV